MSMINLVVLQVLSRTEMTTLDNVKFQILVHFVDTLQSKDFTNIYFASENSYNKKYVKKETVTYIWYESQTSWAKVLFLVTSFLSSSNHSVKLRVKCTFVSSASGGSIHPAFQIRNVE